MNGERFFGICQQIRGEIRGFWSNLADDPIAAAAALREQRAGKYHERIGISRENALRQLKDFHQRNRNWNYLGH